MLILCFIAHQSIACQSIEKLLAPPNDVRAFITYNKEKVTVHLAHQNLSSLDGFETIVEHIESSENLRGRTIAITIAGNSLHTIENKAFISFVTKSPIEHLDLSENKLKQLPPDFLSDENAPFNATLKRVILRGNQLRKLPHSLLRGAPQLKMLDLSQNALAGNSCIPKHLFDNKKKHLHHLLIAGRYQTPPRKGHKLTPSEQDLALAISDTL